MTLPDKSLQPAAGWRFSSYARASVDRQFRFAVHVFLPRVPELWTLGHFAHMKLRTLILAVGLSMLALQAVIAGEIVLNGSHLSVTLPELWRQIPEQRTGILVRAEADSGKLRFILSKPPVAASGNVKDPEFQVGVKRSLRDQGFPKVVRSEVIKVAGSEAYLCEAARNDNTPYSTLQIVWFHDGAFYSLVFASLSKPLKDVPEVQTIIESVKPLPKK